MKRNGYCKPAFYIHVKLTCNHRQCACAAAYSVAAARLIIPDLILKDRPKALDKCRFLDLVGVFKRPFQID